jgi:hypothetical protein
LSISPGVASFVLDQQPMEKTMQLLIDRQGQVRCIYGEAIDLAALGPLTIHRGSYVEPDDQGRWWADLAPVGGPRIGPFDRRSEALDAERTWLETHWLSQTVMFQ